MKVRKISFVLIMMIQCFMTSGYGRTADVSQSQRAKALDRVVEAFQEDNVELVIKQLKNSLELNQGEKLTRKEIKVFVRALMNVFRKSGMIGGPRDLQVISGQLPYSIFEEKKPEEFHIK